MANRATEHLSRIPIATTALIVTNLAIHFTFVVTSAELSDFSLNTRKLLSGEYYRVISSSFTHAGILHVLMNMTSLLQLGSDLESQYGSMKFAIFTLWSILITGALYVLLTWYSAIQSDILIDPDQYPYMKWNLEYEASLFSIKFLACCLKSCTTVESWIQIVWASLECCFLTQVSFCCANKFFLTDPQYSVLSCHRFAHLLASVVEAFHASRPTRSFFGMCSVPSKLFPFLLLIGIQVDRNTLWQLLRTFPHPTAHSFAAVFMS